MWITVNKAALELLVELLRRRCGHEDDEILQEILIDLLPRRKQMGSAPSVADYLRSEKRKA